ncbi:MAG TPA: FAD-dependent oxidoreductase [Chthoniobacterales bacterium]|nr:FAD-dependent oxidoreductase [Chthoniobacterales bacterium]
MKTIAVLGGGSAGFTAARIASQNGARVLFFMGDNADRASLCINAGCMPSKAIFEPIDAMHHAKQHGWLEIKPKQPDEYLAQIVRWKDNEIAHFRTYRAQEIRELASDTFTIIRSKACFVSDHEVVSEGQRYSFDAVIIATGSRTVLPQIDGLNPAWEGIWTSDEILHNTRIPKSLAVIGVGAIGLEFSLRYARLGTKVTLISRKGILLEFPPQFGERIASIYSREGVRVLTNHPVARIARDAAGTFAIEAESADSGRPIQADKILLATGRRPEVDDLGLKAAGVELNERGRLEIGDDMRVKGKEHIFAAGDVAGLRMVVHHAHIEAGIAAENACSDGDRIWTKRSNIEVIFSDPEFAFAGCTLAEAEKDGHQLVSAAAESRDIGKLHLAGDDSGFGEFWADAKTGRLISAGLLCKDAANLIHLPAYAIDHEHTVHQLEDAEFYHPTKIEIVAEIGDALCRKLGGHPFARAEE